MLDKDRALLARAAECRHPGATVTTFAVDLARDLESVLVEPADLIITSALLDLVSSVWLQRLVSITVARQIPFYAAFTYDGRVRLEPDDSLDAALMDAANEHQLRDKGFGPALGPGASRETIALFENAGFTAKFLTMVAESRRLDWRPGTIRYSKDDEYDRLAAIACEHLDVERVCSLIQ